MKTRLLCSHIRSCWGRAAILLVCALLLASCTGDTRDARVSGPSLSVSPSVTSYPTLVAPTQDVQRFTLADLVRSTPGELDLRLPAGDVVVIQLAAIGVFDCRHDCWTDVGADLLPLQSNDQLCLLLVRRDKHMVPVKLWVNRWACS